MYTFEQFYMYGKVSSDKGNLLGYTLGSGIDSVKDDLIFFLTILCFSRFLNLAGKKGKPCHARGYNSTNNSPCSLAAADSLC
jgi:hypothetical protein